MLRIILGIFLMGAAFVAMFMFIGDPAENSLAQQIQTALHCEAGETFVQVLGRYVDNFGTNTDGRELTYYCENATGVRRNVTGTAAFTVIAAFAAPFVCGMLLMLWGIFALVWKAVRKVTSSVTGGIMNTSGFAQPTSQPSMFGQPVTTSTSFVTVDGKQVDPNQIPPEKMQQIQDVFKAMGMNAPQTSSSVMGASTPTTGADFVAQLKQLEDARNQNLITQEEYDRLRKDILDKMA